MKKATGFICFFAALVAADYFLFRGYELVFPFFLMPYAVSAICYAIFVIRGRVSPLSEDSLYKSGILVHFVYFVILLPVFSGLVMSVAWMFKIRFFRDIFNGLFR
ncbi:MAG: hypothetical protein IJ827_02580 [Lachnospiraceae bacterium]|nr:hypothetical protein [Lachnospiraceae bacterium]